MPIFNTALKITIMHWQHLQTRSQSLIGSSSLKLLQHTHMHRNNKMQL